jgi:hypothetical protein
VSALGHYLEEEGIATVAVVLIRPQAENTKPPRALWVPFELGRPFGPPNDPAFQKRVIVAALGMLVEDGGPVRIIDFPDDDQRARPDPASLSKAVLVGVSGQRKRSRAPVRSRYVPLSRPQPPQTAAKVQGFSPTAPGFTAETDSPLEEDGFELPVPRRWNSDSRPLCSAFGPTWTAGRDFAIENGRNAGG